ncbi:hypothetical protein ACFQ44_09585 [Levilactobacillus lanxiensis]|uniref:Uncharacterized protein n=1 Tax=Levilactobacillus lanxiensis TaxID=2799568 RepID=A0ABW4D5R0_9LACO|nr:hypothetical protein [Levilactobacillus lanxiensis]
MVTIAAAVFASKKVQLFLRMSIYVVVGIVVLVVRRINRKKTRKRLDERTKHMMKNTKTDENGKYPWEK